MAEEKKPNEGLDNVQDDDILNPDDFDDNANDNEDTDNPDEEGKTDEVKPDETKSDEDSDEKAKNAHFAKLRREREAREKAAKEQREREEQERKIRAAKLEGELGMVKTNPYTNDPIRDEEDLKIYKLQKELEDEGKDPINDLPRKMAEEARKVAKQAADEEANKKKAEEERRQRIANDIKELQQKYPKLDVSKLADDPLYKECLKGRAGRWSQVEIYELYLVEKAKKDAEAKANKTKDVVDEAGKKMTKTPSSNSTGKVTATDISKMSDEEFEKYYKEKYS